LARLLAGRRRPAAKLDVLDGGEDGQQVIKLEDEPHALRAVLRLAVIGHRGKIDVLNENAAAFHDIKTGEAVEKGGLPAARGPHDGDHLAAVDPEIDASKRLYPHLAGVVRLDDVHGLDDGVVIAT
jgi:hypothetical protein